MARLRGFVLSIDALNALSIAIIIFLILIPLLAGTFNTLPSTLQTLNNDITTVLTLPYGNWQTSETYKITSNPFSIPNQILLIYFGYKNPSDVALQSILKQYQLNTYSWSYISGPQSPYKQILNSLWGTADFGIRVSIFNSVSGENIWEWYNTEYSKGIITIGNIVSTTPLLMFKNELYCLKVEVKK